MVVKRLQLTEDAARIIEANSGRFEQGEWVSKLIERHDRPADPKVIESIVGDLESARRSKARAVDMHEENIHVGRIIALEGVLQRLTTTVTLDT